MGRQSGPGVTLTRLGGGDLHIADFQGKVLLLEVWFTGCPPCMQEAPGACSPLTRSFPRAAW